MADDISSANSASFDEGVAYNMPESTYDAALTELGKGTPMGELMRRYWHPFELSKNITDLPVNVRMMGENLVAFRNENGEVGLVHNRCIHRGSSLFYGKVDGEGIRCCYHGWKFDPQGRCLDQPGEPEGGLARGNLRQPWYPVQEKYGLVWTYMGPPEKKPLFPVIEIFEDLEDGEQLFVDDRNIGAQTTDNRLIPWNWLQHFENLPDLAHFGYLHVMHSGPQFHDGGLNGFFQQPDLVFWEYFKDNVSWERTERGQLSHMKVKPGPDAPTLCFSLEAMLPMWRCVPNPWGAIGGRLDHIGFMIPVDDTHFKVLTVLRGKEPLMYEKLTEMVEKKWADIEADPKNAQRFPDDYEAQISQGPITLHSEEHLTLTDRGVSMLRKIYREQLERMERGEDPIGVALEPGEEVVKTSAGLFQVDE